jgi:hypothetical protein
MDDLQARMDGRGQFSGKECWCLQHTPNVVWRIC